jgi:hypothetical protein
MKLALLSCGVAEKVHGVLAESHEAIGGHGSRCCQQGNEQSQ